MSFFLLFILLLSLIFGGNIYVFWRIKKTFFEKWRLWWVFGILTPLLNLGMMALSRTILAPTGEILQAISYVYIGIFITALWILALEQIGSALFGKLRPKMKWVPLFFFVLILVLGYLNARTMQITELNIETTKTIDATRFAFLSDIHVDSLAGKSFIQRVVDTIQKKEVDFVVIPGDILSEVSLSSKESLSPFGQVQVPIYITLGNHESYGDQSLLAEIFSGTNFKLLRNDSIKIENHITIVGLDDLSYFGSGMGSDDSKNTAIQTLHSLDRDKNSYNILLSHQPLGLRRLEELPVDLQLAGHTHKGQFFPFTLFVGLFNDYFYGLYEYQDSKAFVSQGIGTRGPPIRIGTKSELVIINIEGNFTP